MFTPMNGTATALADHLDTRPGTYWSNWAGTVRAQPPTLCSPRSLDELCEAVAHHARNARRIRPGGARHSFSPIAAPDDVILDLIGLWGVHGIERFDGGAHVTVGAGTSLRSLNETLHNHGLALENMGDSDHQSVGGLISTGTHGTGMAFPSMSNQVVSLTLVTAEGEPLTISAEHNTDLFDAARLSLGALGVIADVTLRTVDAYMVQTQFADLPSEKVLAQVESCVDLFDHFEFFEFPGLRQTRMVMRTRLPADADPVGPSTAARSFEHYAIEGALHWSLVRLARLVPSARPAINRMSMRAWGGDAPTVLPPHEAFPSFRGVRFNEAEWALPIDAFPSVFDELQGTVGAMSVMPYECRFVKGDDLWLSPTYEQDSAYIACHTDPADGPAGLDRSGDIIAAAGGRPHWGKHHNLRAGDLASIYPRFKDFLRVKDRLDPERVFANAHLDAILG